MDRRAFLTSSVFACTGTTGCLDGLVPSLDGDSGQTSLSTATDQAITSNRTAELNVVVLDDAGDPIPDADVSVEMQTHDFHFGTAVNAAHLLQETGDGTPYRTHLLDHFNTAVLENNHKWKQWENSSDRELADSATQWLLEKGLTVRGHAAIWQYFDSGTVPADVREKFHSDDPDRSEYLHDRTMGHVWNIVHHYSGQIAGWDVLNEHLDHHRITEAIEPDHPPQEAPSLVGWFETAKEAAPASDFYYNDYDIITGGEKRRRELETLITYLQKFDAPIDGIGMQGHFGSREEAVNPEALRALLDRFASFDVDVQITEYDTYGDGWTEQDEADHLETVLKTLYGHPAATGFLMWGFWDGKHWQDNAPLFREDWSKKPAYDVYTDLVFEEWWTDDSGVTDANGHYRTQAFLGDYEITATGSGRSKTVTTSLTEPGSETVVVQLS